MSRTQSLPPSSREKSGRWQTLWNRGWLPALLLLVATAIAYQQIIHLGYIWDDDYHVTLNPTLRDLHGLWRIWFEIAATPQYYPLVHTTFWLEYHLWGLNPIGYHTVNVALHVLGAILLWRVLLQLRIPGAWLAAAIFAVHPVEVESVAWITERKNVLSGVFYFAAALAYLRFVAGREVAPSWPRPILYFASLLLFSLALLSKTVACSLPAALLLICWWKTGRIRLRDITPLLPFVVIGFGFGLGTVLIEKYHVGAEGVPWSLTFLQRVLIATRALWFYAGKLFWPAKLTFIYPHWDIDPHAVVQWLFPLAAAAIVALLWWLRARLGRGPLAAVLFFAVTLGPALGFFNVYPFRYSFVADHFQYLASVGLIVLAAAGLNRLPRFVPALLLAGLIVLTWRQVGVYRDLTSLWRDTVEKNPASWMARDNLAIALLRSGKGDEAMVHLRQALQLDPNNVETQSDVASALLQSGQVQESFPFLKRALEIEPNRAAVHYNLASAQMQTGLVREATGELRKVVEIDPTNVPAYSLLGNALLQAGRADESLPPLQKALSMDPDYAPAHFNLANTLLHLGRADEAVAHLQQVLTLDPGDAEAQKNMAWVLATWPEARIRNGAQAVELAESADRLTGGRNPIMGTTLAAAYAEAGRFPEAIKAAEDALQVANDSGLVALAEALRAHIALYRSGHPFRDNRPSTSSSGGD